MAEPDSLTPKADRLLAAITFAGMRSRSEFCERLDIDPRHLNGILRGERRAGLALLARMRLLLGDAPWLYAVGRSDTLSREAQRA